MEKQTVQVLDRAFDILEELAHSREPLGLTELSRRTAISKSTIHRILKTLLERGMVNKTLDTNYTIGPKMFNMLSYHINSLDLQAEAKPQLTALQRSLGLTVYLGVLDGPYVSVIEKEVSDKEDDVFAEVGRRNPAHCSSMGKCLLACLSSEELEEVLYGIELEAFTPNTIINKKEFVRHLHQVRKQGWAVDNEESELDHRCIAAPVFNYRGDAIAVVGVSGTNNDLPDDQLDHISHQVMLTAKRISSAMGYDE